MDREELAQIRAEALEVMAAGRTWDRLWTPARKLVKRVPDLVAEVEKLRADLDTIGLFLKDQHHNSH